MLPHPTSTNDARFLERVSESPSGCWLWNGATSPKGYGQFRFTVGRGTPGRAHRWAYTRWVGLIPEGLTLDHLCRVRRCVNPAHLEPATIAENVHRAAALRTHCGAGHEWTAENIYRPPSTGYRTCRSCARERKAAARA